MNAETLRRRDYDVLTQKIIGAAIEVHTELGPGLLESVYEVCLMKELKARNLKAERQVKLPVVYKGEELSKEFYIDILVEDLIVLELKCVEVVLPVHEVQLVTYLKLADKRLGLLLNFNVTKMVSGIKRKVNNLKE